MRSALIVAQLREQPTRAAITVLAIALGVALCAAVYLVSDSALEEFSLAARKLVGDADLIVRGPRAGFPEALFGSIGRLPGIDVADPMLEFDAALANPAAGLPQTARATLHVLGLDPLRASVIQPALLGEFGADLPSLFATDGIFLSAGAARELGIERNQRFDVVVGTATRSLRVLGVLSQDNYPEPLGVMDIAAAQFIFDRLGELNRIDLRLAPGVRPATVRAELAPLLPPGVNLLAPEVERARAVNVTRAYRVNLNMLALVSLLTGAFLVFSTQSLSVLRRRAALALLRAMGMTRGELERLLLAEGCLLGFIGALLGLMMGEWLARLVLAWFAAGSGPGQVPVGAGTLSVHPLAAIVLVALGTGVAGLGAWVPAREAARRDPARALRAGDVADAFERTRAAPVGIGLLVLGALLALLPAIGGLPLFGYGAIAAILFGAVLLMPTLVNRLLAHAPRTSFVPLDLGIAQLQGSAAQSTVSLAAITVSFSLMIAMAIMVHSFRDSFEVWLGRILPADLQLRVPQGSDTAYLSPAAQVLIRSAPGVARVDFRRSRLIALAGEQPAVLLTARDIDPSTAADELTLVAHVADDPKQVLPAASLPAAWISEALVDRQGARLGRPLELPIAGRTVTVRVVGIFRDYGRSTGSIVIGRDLYIGITHDLTATDASLWLAPRANERETVAALRARLPPGGAFEIRTSGEVRELSLQIFDRAFAVTYALEAIAVLIGLLGVSFAASSTILARRAEFGMLRHLGMRRRQVLGLLASEGVVMSLVGVCYGLALGAALSLVLVYVVNRQSFSWSVDLAVPWLQVAGFSIALVAAAAATATLSGRSAMSVDTVRAVREDW